MGELGFMGMTVPEAYHGAGLDYVSYALALIEIAAGDGAVSTIMSVNNAPVCAILQSAASEALREQYLKPLAAGEMIGAFALTEPQAGSDAANLQTRATRTDGRLLDHRHQAVHHLGPDRGRGDRLRGDRPFRRASAGSRRFSFRREHRA